MRKTAARLRNRRTKSTVFLSPRHRELIESSGKTVQKFFEDLVNFCDELDVFNWKNGQFSYNRIRALLVRSDFINSLCNALPEPYKTGLELGEKARQAYTAALSLDPNQIENYLK